MLKTHIEMRNGKPCINVNGELYPPLAYTTYFDECGEYSDFIANGYKMFFVNVSFTDLPINNYTGFSPFLTGVFEGETPDYSQFDYNVRRIVSECPDALIFPRINIAMPRKWLDSHISETVDTPSGKRESLYSDDFLHDGAQLLEKLVKHIRFSDYAHRVAGYQLCGGATQEWFHHDLSGSLSAEGLEKFSLWLERKYGEKTDANLSKDDIVSGAMNKIANRYGEFCCEAAARTVEHFAKQLKKFINNEQIAGVFYGYNASVRDFLWGHDGLRFIIDSPYIDFFSSPCGYDDNRKLGVDWGDMLPAQSVKKHGKLYFVECDIRTHLTRQMQRSRPGRYPGNIYALYDENGNKTVWSGPENAELSVYAIRKAFAHQLTKGSGIWWFDMWGGWYSDIEIMAEINKMRVIARNATEKKTEGLPSAEVVLFVDERAYFNTERNGSLSDSVNMIRVAMGNTGIPFDVCMVEDAKSVLPKYTSAVFTAPIPSESGKKAVELCKEMNVFSVIPNETKPFYSTEELREILTAQGVHCYDSQGNVVYCAEGFLSIHSASEGEYKIDLPQKFRIKGVLGINSEESECDTLILEMKKYETVIFELFKIG